jgi:NAD(P)-dependent dehydrogenase (short-subunit alcohol dehydrogenase family)
MNERDGTKRTVLITGGTGALGAGVTSQMVEAGYRVLVTWIMEREAEAAQSAFGDAVELIQLDVGDEAAVASVATQVEGEGGLWGLVHLVGGFLADRPVVEMELSEWDRMMGLNARSFANLLHVLLPGMVARGQGGRVVGVGTRAAFAPFAGGSAYAASKAALLALVLAVSEEVKHQGICVNAIVPSVIDTPANRAAMPDADHARWVDPRDLGAVVRFLCSDEARAITGAAIPVYGRA